MNGGWKILVFAFALTLRQVLAQDVSPLSHEDALRLGRTYDGRELGKLWFEKGSEVEPYHHAGRVVLSPGEHASFQLPGGGAMGLFVDEETALLHLDFFVAADGKGYVACHTFKPEVEPVEQVSRRVPSDHEALAPAALLAWRESDLPFLKLLLGKGLRADLPVDSSNGDTLLHYAAWSGDADLVDFLLKNGAKPESRNKYGERPIDQAIDRYDGEEEDEARIIRLLGEGLPKEREIGGLPSGVIDRVFAGNRADNVYFLNWNDADPPEDVLNYLRKSLPELRAASRMTTIETRPLGARTWYRDKEDGRFGRLLEVSFEKLDEDWRIRTRDTSGPVMAGGGSVEKATKKLGFWKLETESSWDE